MAVVVSEEEKWTRAINHFNSLVVISMPVTIPTWHTLDMIRILVRRSEIYPLNDVRPLSSSQDKLRRCVCYCRLSPLDIIPSTVRPRAAAVNNKR